MAAHAELMNVAEGDQIVVTIDDFENTNHPKDENPREIHGEVTNIKDDVGHSGGEIQRTVTVGNPWKGGVHIDVGDTAENKIVHGAASARKYTKAWRPRKRAGKGRLLLGRAVSVGLQKADADHDGEKPNPIIHASDGPRLILADGTVVRPLAFDKSGDELITCAVGQGRTVYGQEVDKRYAELAFVDDPGAEAIEAVQDRLEAYGFESGTAEGGGGE